MDLCYSEKRRKRKDQEKTGEKEKGKEQGCVGVMDLCHHLARSPKPYSLNLCHL